MISWRKVNKISATIIEKTENKLGISLPKDIYNLILEFNHGRPSKFVFDTDISRERVIGSLLEFDSNKKHSNNIINVYNSINNRIPLNMYPFALDPSGNFICFLLGENEIKGIYFWNHEESFTLENDVINIKEESKSIESPRIEFISNSLEDFINNLYIPN